MNRLKLIQICENSNRLKIIKNDYTWCMEQAALSQNVSGHTRKVHTLKQQVAVIEQRLFFITTSSRLQKVFFNPITSFSSSVYVADGKSTCPPPPTNVLRAQMLLLFLHAGRKKTFQNHRPVSTWKSFCCRPLLPSTSSLICQGFSAHSGFSHNSAQTVGEWAQNGTAAAAPEDRRTDGHADSVHPGR